MNYGKRKIKSILLALTVSLLAVCFLLAAVYVPKKGIAANADSEKISDETELETIDNDCAQMIAETHETYKDLKEYSYDAEFDAEMQKTGMTVGEGLVEQICYYQQLLGTTTDEQEIAKINDLINGTKDILDMYQTVAGQSETCDNISQYDMHTPVSTYASVYALAATAVPAAIAWFNASNFLLSAELLTHAWIENFFPGDYTPVNGNRIVGSPATYEFINSTETEKVIEYKIYAPDINNAATCYEEDLGFALHDVPTTRSDKSSTTVHLKDTYDFDVQQDYNPVIKALVAVFKDAQKFGIIGTYEVIIDVDVADALYLKLNSTTNGVHSVSVYNYSDKKIDVAYNTKMCLPEHAKSFNGISDINFITIPAKSFETVKISENALASHITFCYIKDRYRVITYADELYLNRNILNFTFEKIAVPANDMAIITKKGGEWLVAFNNNYGSDMRLDYNSKMCNETDAKTWTGLKDIKTYYLAPNETKFVYISENYFATHISARFVGSTYEYYIYANNLNEQGTMSINRRTEYIYKYLKIENKGKVNGKWKIRVTNPLSNQITVYYNSKMCNYNDAKNWTNLKDDKNPIIIYGNSYKEVYISENWFATSITLCYFANGHRLISYADGLSTNGSMNVYNNRI